MRISRDEAGLCQLLEFNNSEEAKARMFYYELMEKYGNLLSSSEIADLAEIISEELKHTRILDGIIRRRTGIVAEN